MPLFWRFLLLSREEKVVARVLLRVQLGAKLVSFFFESFPKEPPLLTGLLAPHETGDRGAFWLRRQCQLRRVESRVTLLVERALILKCAINPSVGTPQPCPSTAYLPISPDGADSILSPVNQLLLWGSHCLSGWPCPPLLAVHLQASET